MSIAIDGKRFRRPERRTSGPEAGGGSGCAELRRFSWQLVPRRGPDSLRCKQHAKMAVHPAQRATNLNPSATS